MQLNLYLPLITLQVQFNSLSIKVARDDLCLVDLVIFVDVYSAAIFIARHTQFQFVI